MGVLVSPRAHGGGNVRESLAWAPLSTGSIGVLGGSTDRVVAIEDERGEQLVATCEVAVDR